MMSAKPTLPKAVDCCGCMACVAICPKGAIARNMDEEGFLHPSIDAGKCIRCGQCENVCPVLHSGLVRKPIAVYAAKANDAKLRAGSASGGVFTLLAQDQIKRGGVVFGAGFDHATWRVIHKSVRTVEELDDLRGSKYVQSDLGNTYKEAKALLDSGSEVMFSGCPCQIAGLLKFLGKRYSNLTTVDLICHGVPSPLAWRSYLEDRAHSAGAAITNVFSRRYCGWTNYSVSMNFANGRSYLKGSNADTSMQSFMKFWTLRPSCFRCHFRSFRSNADITLGDYANIGDTHPEIVDVHGVSVVIPLTEKGRRLYESLKQEVVSIEMTLEDISRVNTAIYKSHKPDRFRKRFYHEIKALGFDAATNKCLACRQTSLAHHLLWWLKRLIVNHELNSISIK